MARRTSTTNHWHPGDTIHPDNKGREFHPDDACPECGCGFRKSRSNEDNDDRGWTGSCGHFDCGACSLLRAAKVEIWDQYERMRKRYA